ncbi:ATP-binding cassette domain-containing protein [Butyrivibrio sp. INlla16]|uniref:ABC transporter ATP-binding protein n=1 Tax=Butyrivibrio sp. INlla16 TaxID=1520807 RepID=UPI00087E508A|nr:ATP-binding cassette domain-containing protein [Butyrivibrio sp. INlla16]SDB39801.1 NitT/TauT family transport system ATP-binding protein [Butyrivibrio sp. INlla16]
MTIDLENISKSYGARKVLENFNLEIENDHSYVITGASGSGKTTLIRILLSLEEPDSGRVHLMGDYKYPYLNAGVVFQENRLCEQFSAVQNVVMVNKKNSVKVAEEELLRLLPEDAIHKPVSELSGGMKRRVAIVRACAIPSDMLIMDEPFTGLDLDNRIKAIEYIREKQGRNPLLITSHDMEGLDFCRRIEL